MTMSLIAILVSLAMMLTGAGEAGAPAQPARTLVLHNVAVSYNGETQRLDPELRLGAASDGESAVFDFGIDLDGQTLLPIQLTAGEQGLTALFKESGVAVNVTAGAIESLTAQLSDAMTVVESDNPELTRFITEEYLPAYFGLLGALSDESFKAAVQEKSDAILDGIVDRGEGVEGVVVIDDESYDVISYSYAIESEQMGNLIDSVYGVAPELSNYAQAMFKLYDLMPEESGLNGIDSFSDLFDTYGLQMRMDVDEQRSEDGEVQVTDAVLTIDMSNMAALLESQAVVYEDVPEPEGDAVEEPAEGEAEEPLDAEPVQAEPIEVEIHSVSVGDVSESNAGFTYELDGSTLDFAVQASEEAGSKGVDMTIETVEDGEKTARFSASFILADNPDGGSSYGGSYNVVVRDTLQLDVAVYGDIAEDGTSENTVSLDGRTPDAIFGLSFDADVNAEPIEDMTGAAESTVVIDDLSEEALEALGEDQNLIAAIMKVSGSLGMDANKLVADESLKNLSTLLSGEHLPIAVEDQPEDAYDYTYEIDGDDGDFLIEGLDGDFEDDFDEAEDDGELGFDEPQLTWLPAGWSVTGVEADTAYDWVGIAVADEDGQECLYATFFADIDGEQASYVVTGSGAIQEGRAISVSDYGEGGMSVTLREGGLYGTLSFASGAIDVETIGRIVAGIQF